MTNDIRYTRLAVFAQYKGQFTLSRTAFRVSPTGWTFVTEINALYALINHPFIIYDVHKFQ